MAHKSARRNRAVWDRPATGTRLLLWPQPIPVSLGNPLDPLRMSLIASAPSRPNSPQCHRAADARVPSPRMITHGSHPQRACPTTVDACGIAPRMISRSALIGVEADACGIAPRMISRFTLLGVEADACGIAPRMISHVPSQAAEGALATLILTLSQSLSLCPSSSRRGNWPVALGRGIPTPLHPRKETV